MPFQTLFFSISLVFREDKEEIIRKREAYYYNNVRPRER